MRIGVSKTNIYLTSTLEGSTDAFGQITPTSDTIILIGGPTDITGILGTFSDGDQLRIYAGTTSNVTINASVSPTIVPGQVATQTTPIVLQFTVHTGYWYPVSTLGGIGNTGPLGGTGAVGNTGPTGPLGDPGGTGGQGFTGDKGSQGMDGSIGNMGVPGNPGGDGGLGAVGFTGPMGDDGSVGDPGTPC